MRDRTATAVLISAYGLGQGSVFLLLFITRTYVSTEIAGLLVIALSIISLAQQFGDIGNNPLLVAKLNTNGNDVVAAILRTRSLVGFAILLAFCFWSYFTLSIEVITKIKPIFLIAPPLALILGTSCAFAYEAKRHYRSVALFSLRLWLVITASLTLSIFTETYFFTAAALFCLSIAHTTSLSKTYPEYAFFSIWTKVNVKQAFTFIILPIIASAVAGQIWYRYQVLFVADHAGLTQLSSLGLVKSMQTALILAMGFLIRPIMQRKLQDSISIVNSICLIDVVRNLRYPLLLVTFVAVTFVCFFLGNTWHVNSLMAWSPLFFGLPFAVASILSSQLNSIQISTRILFGVDQIGMLLNVAIFFLLYEFNLPIAVVSGEIVQHVWNILVRLYLESRRQYMST